MHVRAVLANGLFTSRALSYRHLILFLCFLLHAGFKVAVSENIYVHTLNPKLSLFAMGSDQRKVLDTWSYDAPQQSSERGSARVPSEFVVLIGTATRQVSPHPRRKSRDLDRRP